MKKLVLVFALLSFQSLSHAQTPAVPVNPEASTIINAPVEDQKDEDQKEAAALKVVTSAKASSEFPKLEFKSYGYMVYGQKETFKTVQNLKPITRREMDLAEIAFEGEYLLNENAKFEFEVEIEHGGVGTTIEFDPFEEFGEFESEIEKGGEVVLPEFYYKKTFPKTNTALKVGKFPVFIALGSVLTKPSRNASIIASDVEGRMIPVGWTEMGVQVEQKYKGFTVRAGAISGLNSEFFRTYSWIGGGYQRHFETSNADDIATLISLEWGDVVKGSGIAVGRYQGNTTGNRYKVDKMTEEAVVTLDSAMATYKYGRIGFAGELIYGDLSNSNIVSQRNATLGGLAKPKAFSALGHKAVLESVQLSYDAFEEFTVYVKAEHVDTFADAEGTINKNPRYDVSKRSAGFVWFFDTAAFLKFQFLRENTELLGLPETSAANFAFGFDLDRFN